MSKPVTKWGPADWKRLPSWMADLEMKRWIDSRRVTRAVNEPPRMWWTSEPWREHLPVLRRTPGGEG